MASMRRFLWLSWARSEPRCILLWRADQILLEESVPKPWYFHLHALLIHLGHTKHVLCSDFRPSWTLLQKSRSLSKFSPANYSHAFIFFLERKDFLASHFTLKWNRSKSLSVDPKMTALGDFFERPVVCSQGLASCFECPPLVDCFSCIRMADVSFWSISLKSLTRLISCYSLLFAGLRKLFSYLKQEGAL